MARITYHEAAIPEPWQILGLRLKPFCLGHYLHMARFGIAFVDQAQREAKLSDLIIGVLICSMTYEGFTEFIQTADWKEELKAWGTKAGDFKLEEKVALMNRYIEDGSRQPAVIFEGPASRSGAHWGQTLKVALLQIGYEKSQALNLPLTEAFADFYRNAESQGVVTIADSELAAALDDEFVNEPDIAPAAEAEAACPK